MFKYSINTCIYDIHYTELSSTDNTLETTVQNLLIIFWALATLTCILPCKYYKKKTHPPHSTVHIYPLLKYTTGGQLKLLKGL